MGGCLAGGLAPEPPAFKAGDKCCLQSWTCLSLGFTSQIQWRDSPVVCRPGGKAERPLLPACPSRGGGCCRGCRGAAAAQAQPSRSTRCCSGRGRLLGSQRPVPPLLRGWDFKCPCSERFLSSCLIAPR